MTKLITLFILSLWCLSGFCSDRTETNESANSGSAKPKKNWTGMWNKETSSASTSSFSPKSIDEPSASKYHTHSHSVAQSSRAGSKLYTCTDCSQQFTERSNLSRHRRSKHDKVKYVCSVCYDQFAYPSSLDEHKKSIHEGIRYECSTCSKTFSNLSNLNQHKKNIHEGVTFVCPICDKRYSSVSNSYRHRKTAHN